MAMMERIQRSAKARQGEGERAYRSKKQEQQPAQQSPLGNQAMLRMLAAKKRQAGKPPTEEPDNPDAKAAQVVGQFESDPMDQSGRARADLGGLEPGQRDDVMGRVQDKVSQTQFGRMGQIIGESAPRSPEAPPKDIQPGQQPEAFEAAPAHPEADAEGKQQGGQPDAAPEAKQDKAETKKPEEAKSAEAKAGPAANSRQREEDKKADGEKAETPVGKKPKDSAAKGADSKGAPPAKKADTAKGEKPAAQQQSEATAKDKAEGKAETEKAAKANQPAGQAQEASAKAAQPGQNQAANALSDLPADAKGGTQAPASAGAPARQAAAQSGPAVAVAGGGGGGGGSGGAEAALEEGGGPESQEQEAAGDKTEEKMASAEGAGEPEEDKQPEPQEPDAKADTEDDLKKKPSAEDEEAVKQAERERQEQVRSPEGPSATQAGEPEQEPPPADHTDGNPAEARAGLDSLAEPVGGGGEAGGGGGGGGAIAEQPQPEPPRVEALAPVAAMGAVSGLKVGQIANSIAGVQSSVAGKMSSERTELSANAPSMERPSGAPQTRSAPLAFAEAAKTGKAKVEETPAGEAVATEAPQLLPEPGPAPTEQINTPAIQGGGEGGAISEADAQNIESAVQEVPTSDPALNQNAGPAPTVELAGDADPQQAADQRAALDQSIIDQQRQGTQDAAQPMGENEIYPVVPKETLKAQIPQSGGAGAAAGAAPVDDETTAIVAEEKQGDEVRASATQASSDMQTGEEDQATQAEQEKADHESKVQALEQENAAQQADERGAAAEGVQQLRGKWSQGQQDAVDKAHGDADAAQETMSTEVATRRQQGNENAAAEIDKGNQDATQIKDQAEGDASREKAKAEQESSGGILGWIASKAKAFFEGLKKAVHAVFDLARKALKAAIEGAKKLAAAAIDLARDAIVSAIRLAGKALVAVGDVALAAFPGLRDKFRGYIEDKVKAAEDAVNKLADDLKAGINKLLDLLGAALDGLLNLLEKAYMMAIDIVATAVQGAIKAAQAAIALLGMLATIIKDIAAHPGQWIANLGAAIIDGIKNHLWKAFKDAVKEWFFSKLEEVLGVGKMIFDVLFKGGIKLAEVGKMAFEGLKAAIPMALIGILVEKLVAMIVPAAGAVMAIIEGLQAAWGTISRILQAIDRFVSFLKAVKTGNAGPQFAQVLAGAAIIVIDFVANWLLKKIRGPASKIGGKIKAIAKKIMEKLKAVAKKIWGKIKKAFKKIAGKIKAGFNKVKEKLFGKKKKGKAKQKDDKKKKKKKEKDVQEAMTKTKAAVEEMLTKGTRPLMMRARLAYLKFRYGWKDLSLKQAGGSYSVHGQINPDFDLPANVSFKESVVHVSDLNMEPDKIASAPSIDRPPTKTGVIGGSSPAEFASAAVLGGVMTGIVPGGGSRDFEYLGGGSPEGRLNPKNKNLDPSKKPDAKMFLGERQYKTNDPIAPISAKPDAVVLQTAGGKLIRSINIEATLDAELSQSHKADQLTRTILAAQDILGKFPNVSPDLEIHYVILAPKSAESAKAKLQPQFDSLKGKVVRNVTVTWIYIQGL